MEERTANLTTEQIELLETLQSKPQTVNVHLVTIPDATDIDSREQLFLNLPDGIVLTADLISQITLQREQVRWNGTFSNDDSEVRLLVTQNSMMGMIRSKTHNYDVHPLRNSGFHVLVEIDPSGFEREEPPLKIEANDNSDKQERNTFYGSESTILSNPEIRVMVVYTTNAKNNYSGDIGSAGAGVQNSKKHPMAFPAKNKFVKNLRRVAI